MASLRQHCSTVSPHLLLPAPVVSYRVKTATTHTTSIGGLPTFMEYTLSAAAEKVADSRFMRSDPNRAGDALLVATDSMIYTLAEA
jgi:hypothetical protein